MFPENDPKKLERNRAIGLLVACVALLGVLMAVNAGMIDIRFKDNPYWHVRND